MFRNSPRYPINGTPKKRVLNLLREHRSPSKSPSRGDGTKMESLPSENQNHSKSTSAGNQSPSKKPSNECLGTSQSSNSMYPPLDFLKTPTKEELASMRRDGLINSAIASAEASFAKAKLPEWEMVPSPDSVVKMLGDDLPHNLNNPSIEAMKTPTKQQLSDEQEKNLINVAIAAATAKPKSDESGWEIIQAPGEQEEILVYEAIHQQSVKTRRKLAMKIAVTLMDSGYQKLVDHIMNSAANQSPFSPGITGMVVESGIIIVAEIVNEFFKQKGIRTDKFKPKHGQYSDLK